MEHGNRLSRILGRALAALCLWLSLALAAPAAQANLDVDGDNATTALTDGLLIIRHLFGLSGDALTSGALGNDATRNAAAIASYIDGLGYLDVDGDGTTQALTDGLLIIRHLFGLSGTALTSGALSAEATRTDPDQIAQWLDNAGNGVSQVPSRVELVAVNSLRAGEIQLDWLPSQDNDTPAQQIRYRIHTGTQANFLPDGTTLAGEVTDAQSATIDGLGAGVHYHVKVQALDLSDHASLSNELDVITATATPALSGPEPLVLDQTTAPSQTVTPGQISYPLGSGAPIPQVGEILVSPEGDGYLRRATAVTQNGGQVNIQTEPAALNEVFSGLELSTSIRLVDLAQSRARAAASLGGAIIQRSIRGTSAHWPESGLTLIDEPLRPAPTARASTDPIQCDGASGARLFKADGPLHVTYPGPLCVEPTSDLQIDITAEIEAGQTDRYQVTQLLFLGLTHKPELDGHQSNYGASWSLDPGNSDTRGKGILYWTPTEAHVDGKLRPYTAEFVALAKEREAYCSGIGVITWCEEKEVHISIPVGVTWGELPGPKDYSFEATGELQLSASAAIDFQPEVQAEMQQNALGKVQYARVAVQGPLSFETEVRLTASGQAQAHGSQELLRKRFLKVFQVGAVPVVMSGTLVLRAEYNATADAAIDLKQHLDLGYDLEAGLQYSDSGGWEVIKEASPWQRYQLTGEANVHAYVDIRFVPDLEIKFYEAATGHLIVEPYLYAEAALEGHFLYRYLANQDGVEEGSDADYRFTKLEFGGGIDAKFRAGLEIFDIAIAGYPSTDPNEFQLVTVLDQTPILGLPALRPQQGTQTNVQGAVELLGGYENVPNPFHPLFSDKPSLNPFSEGSAHWQVVLPNGTETLSPHTQPTDAWFGATESGQYRLRFSGHSALGSFFRQYEELVVDYTSVAPGITVTPTTGLVTTEAGGSDSFSIVLRSQPTADVTIGLTSSDTGEGTPSPASLIFTPGNWSSPQTVTVTGVDDDVSDGDIAYTIQTAAAVSADANYDGLDPVNVDVTNQDNAQWLTENAYQTEFDLQVTNGFYPAEIDGRNFNGEIQFRGNFVPIPTGTFSFNSVHGWLQGDYEQLHANLIMDGYQQAHLQTFVDASGATRYQSTWVKQDGPPPPPTGGPLNDTGITFCTDGDSVTLACPVSGFPGQDAEHGRDVTHDDDSDGHAGFNFTKLDAEGNPLSASAEEWSCVHDNVTGLIWEVKTNDGGLHDRDGRYKWYNLDPATNGGGAGYANSADGSICYGFEDGNPTTYCNTQAYATRINNTELCGGRDWRLPSVNELMSIVDHQAYNATHDGYFPWSTTTYWSSSPHAGGSGDKAWIVDFGYGQVYTEPKDNANSVLLVRTGP